MADNSIAKVQHYVPQFLRRNFGAGKKDQLHVFDNPNARTGAGAPLGPILFTVFPGSASDRDGRSLRLTSRRTRRRS